MTRARDGLVRTRVGLANQLRDQLATLLARRLARCSARLTRRSRWRSFRRYPSPVDARGLGEQRLASFLKRHSYHGSQARHESCSAGCATAAEGRAGELEMQARRSDRARARLSARTDRRPDQRADHRDPPRARGASRRTDVPLAVHRPRTRGYAPRRCSPRSATAASATPPTARSPPTPAKPRSPSNPAKQNTRSSDGHATTDYALAFCHPRRLKPPPQPVGRGHLQPRPRPRR